MDEKIFKAEMPIAVSQEDVDDIMVGAMEGGINYWCDEVTVIGDYLGEYASEQISRGGQLKFHDFDEEEDHILDLDKFMEGVKKWVQKPVGCNCLEFVNDRLELDCGNADAEVCDAIIQYALFGDVIYG